VTGDGHALLRTVLDRDVDDVVRRLGEVLDPDDHLEELIDRAVAVFLDFVVENRREYLVLFGQAGRGEPEVTFLLHDLHARLATVYLEVFRGAAARAGVAWPSDDQARLTTYALMALCEGMAQAWIEGGEATSRDQVQALAVGMIRRALGP
jgi:AcrR family transcriptional regulator